MEKQLMFHILGIEETKDEQVIRDAYRAVLRTVNPEDDPDGFKRLREAYEGAINLARRSEENEEKEKTEIDLWVDRVDEIYQDIVTRCDEEEWKEALSDPLCQELDTSLQIREALLVYFMDHIYLPHSIWKLIDKEFQILEDQENLLQKFPKDFLDYIVYYTEHQSFIDYELFQVRDREKADADAYIRGYLEIKREIDQGQKEGALKRLEELDVFGVYHPYADAEKLRLLCESGESWREDREEEDGLPGELTARKYGRPVLWRIPYWKDMRRIPMCSSTAGRPDGPRAAGMRLTTSGRGFLRRTPTTIQPSTRWPGVLYGRKITSRPKS